MSDIQIKEIAGTAATSRRRSPPQRQEFAKWRPARISRLFG